MENEFRTKLNNLFDIAHADALTLIKIEEDRQFLLAQREPGRRGHLGSVDTALAAKEARKFERIEKEKKRFEKAKTGSGSCSSSNFPKFSRDKDYTIKYLSCGRNNVEGDQLIEKPIGGTVDSPPTKRARKTKINVITPSLTAALDRTRMSDRMATFVLAETAHSLGHNIENLNISRSSIKRRREKHRAQIAAALKQGIAGDAPLVVHWDGKLMCDLSGKQHVDRLPVIVSSSGASQLLKVCKLSSGSGENQSEGVIEALDEWNVKNRIVGMCFDTTSSNTGRHVGTCVKLEEKLGKDLLYFACRHHIMELLAAAAFQVSLPLSSAPEVLLFKRFQKNWHVINQNIYSTCDDIPELSSALSTVKEEIKDFAKLQLSKQINVRNDYREILELSIIFLGDTPPRGIHFQAPGAMHHARWMSKVIYSLKMCMFHSQFKLTPSEEKGLQEMCKFIIILYLKAWFTAPLAACAPRNDLCLLNDLYQYKKYNKNISKETCKKMEHHLWYSSEQMIGLAFFDTEVSISTKRKMVNALYSEQGNSFITLTGPKRIVFNASSAAKRNLEDFVTSNTIGFFTKLNITTEFLKYDPKTWYDREDYKAGLAIVKKILVTNDNAERGIALVKQLNRFITYNEDQFQFLTQVVEDHRKLFTYNKRSLMDTQDSTTR